MRKIIPALLFISLFAFFPCAILSAFDQNTDNKNIKVGILMNGDACNINWKTKLKDFDVYDASVKNFLASQNNWELKKRLLDYKPDYCLIYLGLPDLLLQQSVTDIVNAYINLSKRMSDNGIVPVIIGILPVVNHSALNSQIELFNTQLKYKALINDFLYAEINNNMIEQGQLKSEFTTDGFSLNKKGLKVFSENIAEYLSDLLMFKSSGIIPLSTAHNFTKKGIEKILNDSPQRINIVMLGNSITAGGGNWNKRLGRNDIRNAGIGGYTSGQMLWHIDATVLSAKPQICFIMAGINDLFNNIPIEIIHKNQIKILEELTSNSIKPIVELTLFVNNNPKLNERIKDLNNQLSNYCNENQIDIIDLNNILSDENGLKEEYTTDGTHLKELAYDLWCNELKTYLGKINIY